MYTTNQDQFKALAAHAALEWIPQGQIIGVGTGSTVNKFIDLLPLIKEHLPGAVSSSQASSARLKALGIEVLDCNEVPELAVYVDGADEIDSQGFMIKGGGGALTREKIVASLARMFVCIADASKLVPVLGRFPLPVEIIPMAARHITARFARMGARAQLRLHQAKPFVTDNGGHILDVQGLTISSPLALEREITLWPGVITCGVFAQQKAQVCLVGQEGGATVIRYP